MDSRHTHIQDTDKKTFQIILDKLKKADLHNKAKGSIFEKLSKHLLKEQDTADQYQAIYLWNEWDKRDGADCGIDLVIETKEQQYIAVQCKFYNENKLDLSHTSTYLSKLQSGINDINFSKGILIHTSDLTANLSKEIKQIEKSRGILIDHITLDDFINSNINWESFNPSKLDLPLNQKKIPKPHQLKALKQTKKYFTNPLNTRGKLIMACGTGKTLLSLKIIEELTCIDSTILFLAPSIALLGQTFREYRKERNDDFIAAIVCSDSTSGKDDENDDLSLLDLPKAASTNPNDIKQAYHIAKKHKKRLIIFSTYHSTQKIKEAQDLGFINAFDLIICDEAHRSVGKLYSSKEKEKLNAFTMCHSDEYIKAKKRIYMSATPRIYANTKKSTSKALESGNDVFSMDDEEIFGKTIYNLNFRQAVDSGLLSDYKVIILAIQQEGLAAKIANNAIAKLKQENITVDLEFVCKIIGTYKGLARKDLTSLTENGDIDNEFLEEMDTNHSKRVINFCRSIKASKNITHSFKTIMDIYDKECNDNSLKDFKIHIDHIDGMMNARERLDKLNILNNPKEDTCNILSNAKCLSEGIDVPALDSVVFFDAKNSIIEIIQALGRVMRKAEHKKTGYIILPLALSENELKHLDEAMKNTNFQAIWAILKALRSHDDSLVDEAVFKEKIKIAIGEVDTKKKGKGTDTQQPSLFIGLENLQSLANAMYNAIPIKLGDKGYWASFTAKTAKIVEKLNARLNSIFQENPSLLVEFLESLHKNIHPNIKPDEAKDMICSHIITAPIFEILFKDTMKQNPIRKALDTISDKLHNLGLDTEETSSLNALYQDVERNAQLAKSEKSKQELIKNLYDTFFQSAFKKQAQKLGIVYTPIEVIDFILHSTNALLKRHFKTDFNDKAVKIFDPFTGSGSFIARLLSYENTLIDDKNFTSKFLEGIFAQDIVLLAYYIALINITQIAQSRLDSTRDISAVPQYDNNNILCHSEPALAGEESHVKNLRDVSLVSQAQHDKAIEFTHIALADSLDYLENPKQELNLFADSYQDLEENKSMKDFIAQQEIQVIIGNPPYSGGARSENDNNANIAHPNLEKRVRESYGKDSKAQNQASTRDTLIQSIRMASDRLKDKGILGFVVNGSFIDSSSADGFRKCVAKEFSHIYIINLRGNQRTQGETSRKEGGKIFDSGSRASVAIVFFVKDSNVFTPYSCHYNTMSCHSELREESHEESQKDNKDISAVPQYDNSLSCRNALCHSELREESQSYLGHCPQHDNTTAQIFYHDIGDYLSRDDKLAKLTEFKSLESVPFENIVPNAKGDWINQRGEAFTKLMPLKSEEKQQGIFYINSCGVKTNRDAWVYNFSKEKLQLNMQKCIDTYNANVERFDSFAFKEQYKDIKSTIYINT